MIKRILLGIILVASIAGISVYYITKEKKPATCSAFQAVPLDAALLLDIRNYAEFRNSILKDNTLWSEMSMLPLFGKLNHTLCFIDSMERICPSIASLLTSQRPVLISAHPSGKEDFQLIYYFQVEEEKEFRGFDNFVKGFSASVLTCKSREYESSEIHDVAFTHSNTDNFSYTWTHGLMVLSRSPVMIEKVIRQLIAQESLLNKKSFTDIVKTGGKNSVVNLYLNYEHIPRMGWSFLLPKSNDELETVRKFGSWMELDLNLKSDMLILNGFSVSDSLKSGLEALFINQKPVKIEVYNKVPSISNALTVLGISNFGQYMKDYASFLQRNGKILQYNAKLQFLKTEYNIDLTNSFNELFDQEVCLAFAKVASDTLVNQAYSIIRTKSADDAEKTLTGFVSEFATKNNLKNTDLIKEVKLSGDQTLKIWQFPFGNIPALLFGNLFSVNDNRYCTLVDNYMIFGNSPEAMVKYVQQLNTNTNLGNDNEFNNFSEYFSSQSNFLFYIKPSTSDEWMKEYLNPAFVASLDTRNDHFKKISALVYQFNISNNNLLYNNLFLKYTTATDNQGPSTNWTSNLDARVSSKVTLLKDLAAGEQDVFVQDEKNQIYLIDKTGKVLWKIKLTEPVMGDVFAIDYYKNHKLQVLFNTRSKLYLLDRNGNAVENYPIDLKSAATNGLAVFDYDQKRDYRIVVAGSDHKVYVFDKDGKPNKGWAFRKTDSNVEQPVQYFKVAGKDLVVFNDHNHLYIVDRKGKTIGKPGKNFPFSTNNKASLLNAQSLKEARLVLTDTTGKIISTTLDGKSTISDFGNYPGRHWFDVYDVDGDGTKDFIFTYGSNLKVVTQKNKEIFSVESKTPISYRPEFCAFPDNKTQIGFVTASDEKVYLYNATRSIGKGFPIKGSSQFVISLLNNSENRFNLIVGCNSNCLYNYNVH
jgi:hypothetical protein